MLYYFAYGSNLHPLRLQQRVPSARLIGVTEVPNHRLAFHKRGQDNSGKCNLLASAGEGYSVYGAIYRIDRSHKKLLDGFEGCGNGYIDREIEITRQGRDYPCFTYSAQESHIEPGLRPYHWYKELVILGAIHLELPADYVRELEQTASIDDLHMGRKLAHENLILKIKRSA